MNDQLGQGNLEKVNAYLTIIEERVLYLVRKPEIQKSCTASLMLLFAALDGLAKLYAVEYNPKEVGTRFKEYLEFMNGKYRIKKDEIYLLRNSIIHSAINFESYMSHESETQSLHLEVMDSSGYIFINTGQFRIDLENSINKFKEEMNSNAVMANRAESRLELKEVVLLNTSEVSPTPPPGIDFVRTK